MNGSEEKGEKNRTEEKERGGRVTMGDWQLVSVAWPLWVRLQVFSTGLEKDKIKSKNVNLFSIVSSWKGGGG